MLRSPVVVQFLVGIALLMGGGVCAADMSLSDLLPADSSWELISEGHQFTEGPAADAQGRVYFTDVPRNEIFKIDLDGKVSLFAGNTSATNGLMFGPDGRLYGCQNGKKQIVAFDANGQSETIVSDVESNDLVVTSHGAIYFTDPSKNRVWYASPTHEKKIVAEGLRPNGIILSPDESTLVVTDSRMPFLWAFRAEIDGSLTSKIPYFGRISLTSQSESPGSDGLTVDRDGRIYVATHAGIQFFDGEGRMSGVILKPQHKFLSNLTFGGAKRDYLYVTCSDKVYRRRMNTVGWAPFPHAAPKP